MASEKILKQLEKYLGMGKKKRRNERNKLKELLSDLSRKEKLLKVKIKQESNKQKSRRLQKELQVVHAQRKKGVAALRKTRED